ARAVDPARARLSARAFRDRFLPTGGALTAARLGRVGAMTASRHNHNWYALALICVAQFMVVLDVSIVNVALPSIKNALHFSETNLQWVISAYTLVAGGFLLLG